MVDTTIYIDQIVKQQEEITKLIMENDRYRMALEDIAYRQFDTGKEAVDVATAALERR